MRPLGSVSPENPPICSGKCTTKHVRRIICLGTPQTSLWVRKDEAVRVPFGADDGDEVERNMGLVIPFTVGECV